MFHGGWVAGLGGAGASERDLRDIRWWFPGNANLLIGIIRFLNSDFCKQFVLVRKTRAANQEIGVPGAGASSENHHQTVLNLGIPPPKKMGHY